MQHGHTTISVICSHEIFSLIDLTSDFHGPLVTVLKCLLLYLGHNKRFLFSETVSLIVDMPEAPKVRHKLFIVDN